MGATRTSFLKSKFFVIDGNYSSTLSKKLIRTALYDFPFLEIFHNNSHENKIIHKKSAEYRCNTEFIPVISTPLHDWLVL
jgi:hypothetical protein